MNKWLRLTLVSYIIMLSLLYCAMSEIAYKRYYEIKDLNKELSQAKEDYAKLRDKYIGRGKVLQERNEYIDRMQRQQ